MTSSSSSTRLSLALPPPSKERPLENVSRSLHLLPFHIDYSGHAKVKEFFRVQRSSERQAATASTGKRDGRLAENDGQDGLKIEDGQGEPMQIDAPVTRTSTCAHTTSPPTLKAALRRDASDVPERTVATFRGRTVQGVITALPAGYVGLVLRSADASSIASGGVALQSGMLTSAEDAASRQIRSSTPKPTAAANPITEGKARTLTANGTFDTFTLWASDVPADNAQDGYARAIREWATIGKEVHSWDED